MSKPGFGAMLHYLSGGSRNSPEKFYGKRITAARMDEGLFLSFEDGTEIKLWDDGQSCCESRYMTTDDDLNKIVGGTLTRIETKEGAAPEQEDEYGEEHEVVFIEVGTDQCFITVATHNEHNGYYGGFGLTIDVVHEPIV